MAPAPKHRYRRGGQVFYLTILIISLLALVSVVRSLAEAGNTRHKRNLLGPTSTRKREEKCRHVHEFADQCAFVRKNCPEEEAGLISYLQLYYCSLSRAKAVAFVILVLWISLLFSTIGIAASDFLCINLSTIASVLGMSESLTGVTFLAFGNGSPDVFSTFAAMSSHSGSLAVGELLGAAGFITAVVAGSMALVKPFQVARKSFVRDVGFFAVASAFSMVFLADGVLRMWECACMIAFYIFYVMFVVIWHWYLKRWRARRGREVSARLHQHIPGTQELEVPELPDDEEAPAVHERRSLLRTPSGDDHLDAPYTPALALENLDEDDEARDRYLAQLRRSMRVSRPHRGERRNTMTPIRPSLIGALEFRAVLSSFERRSTSNTQMTLRRYSDVCVSSKSSDTLSVASQPDLSATNSKSQSHDNMLPPPASTGRSRAVSANDVEGLRLDPALLTVPGTVSEPAVQTSRLSPPPQSPQLLVSPPPSSSQSRKYSQDPAQPQSADRLAPPAMSFHRPDYEEESQHHRTHSGVSPRMTPSLQVPRLQLPHPDHSRPTVSSPLLMYTDSPGAMTPDNSRPPSIFLPEPSISAESARRQSIIAAQYMEDGDEMQKVSWWPYRYLPAPQVIITTLFPTLYGWREKSILDKLLGLVTFPSVFLLNITLPVVETEGRESTEVAAQPSPHMRHLSRHGTLLPPDSPYVPARSASTNMPPHPHKAPTVRQDSDFPAMQAPTSGVDASNPDGTGWNRWLLIVQIFTAPLFIVVIVWANVDDDHHVPLLLFLLLGSSLFSFITLTILLLTTSAAHAPPYRPLFCFLGFLVAIAWISTIANEVVGVLKAFGVILGISDAILGLTIFAVGNSLGDLVADITVAKLGFPVMALSACFGGPMLNILLGIGIAGVYMTLTKGNHYHDKHPHTPWRDRPYEIDVSTTLVISGITLLVTLVGLLILVPLNGWKMDRKIGWGLIALWCLSTTGNVVAEVLGFGGELELSRSRN